MTFGARDPAFFWSVEEDQIIAANPLACVNDLADLLPKRSTEAIRRRRVRLGYSLERSWTPEEDRELRRLATHNTAVETARILKSRTRHAVIKRAKYLRIKFPKKTRIKPTGCELADAVRRRCREDGISLADLDRELGFKSFFTDTVAQQVKFGRKLDLQKIGAAVEFFGGRLTIDWQDQ